MSDYKFHKFGELSLIEDISEVKYGDASEIFGKLFKNSSHNFLLESRDISHIYGRLSLMGIDPVLKIIGKDNDFRIVTLNNRAQKYIDGVMEGLKDLADEMADTGEIAGKIICRKGETYEESERTKQKNITQVIRLLLKKYKSEQKGFLGLYGAFAYDLVRLFEDIPENLPAIDVPDFTLCLYDTFIFVDHLKEKSELVLFRNLDEGVEDYRKKIHQEIDGDGGKTVFEDDGFEILNAKFDLEKDGYENQVRIARDLARRGELFEVVLSNELNADFKGDSFALYLKYRDINPSPYLFYFDFEDEQLVGASPEMMVRCEHGEVHLRPISGTAPRGKDPVEDHEHMLELLNSPKERAELDMLIDLGRNDLSRICEPGIEVSDYRFVEKYSRVMHTVAHLTGKLRSEFTAFDSLVACINAGTLTGAPKVAAMTEIHDEKC